MDNNSKSTKYQNTEKWSSRIILLTYAIFAKNGNDLEKLWNSDKEFQGDQPLNQSKL